MSALLSIDSPESARPPEPADHSYPPFEAGPTLDDVVSRTWEVLRAAVPASCLVCGGELEPRPAAGAGLAGGRCDSCGSTLA
jgi:hypothetical protein